PAVGSEEAPELVVAGPRQLHSRLMTVGDHQVDHALAILALAQPHAVIALDQLGVLLPAPPEHSAVLVPEDCLVALAGDVISGRRAGDRLPDLDRGLKWPGDERQRLDAATTVVDLPRWQLIVLAVERKTLVVP